MITYIDPRTDEQRKRPSQMERAFEALKQSQTHNRELHDIIRRNLPSLAKHNDRHD
ncbi:hypothetical protein [Brucella intermedia]|uniref:hypothetical protein n=1 Tax=Brucella intermedia TaxID=94625 RepID=UPI00187A24DA|nr:hypothetical protein [Brucella intermedia]